MGQPPPPRKQTMEKEEDLFGDDGTRIKKTSEGGTSGIRLQAGRGERWVTRFPERDGAKEKGNLRMNGNGQESVNFDLVRLNLNETKDLQRTSGPEVETYPRSWKSSRKSNFQIRLGRRPVGKGGGRIQKKASPSSSVRYQVLIFRGRRKGNGRGSLRSDGKWLVTTNTMFRKKREQARGGERRWGGRGNVPTVWSRETGCRKCEQPSTSETLRGCLGGGKEKKGGQRGTMGHRSLGGGQPKEELGGGTPHLGKGFAH